MPILNIVTQEAGLVGVDPKWVYIATNDTIAEVTAAGYLNKSVAQGYTFSESDIALVTTLATPTSPVTVNILELSKSGSNWSLVASSGPGGVTLPTIANHLIISTNATGTLANLTGTAINSGSIQAGLSGTAGTLISFPSTATNGSLILAAVNAGGAFNTTISNGTMGQSTVMTIPDVGAATGQFVAKTAALVSGNLIKASGTAGVVVDAGFAVLAKTTAAYAGGGTSNAFTATGLATTSIVTAVILTSTNDVSIAKAVPTANTLTVTFSADPGANTTVNYISVTPAV